MWKVIAAESNPLIEQELAYIILLAIAAAVAIIVRRIRLPYTVALVLVGLALSFAPNLIDVNISKDLILAVLVPPLLFEAALHLEWSKLRKYLIEILLIALVGTLIGSLIVAYTVSYVLDDIPFAAAIAFGALISATDPVAVIAFFKTLGVDKRLAMLVEGESLFNDGAAIVIFNIALAAGAAINANDYAGFNLLESVTEFGIVAGGGLLVGAVLGGLVAYIILKNVDDHLIETSVTLCVAYGSFLLAEYFGKIIGFDDSFHFSGILAVVAASLFVGNVGRINTSPTTKVTIDNFWEFLSFIVNSLVFLIIGLKIDITLFAANIIPILLAVTAVLVSRMVVVYGLSGIYGLVRPKNHIPTPYQHVMFWGGLRGAISLALALVLEEVFPGEVAETLQVMTFGVVLFTLLVQGLSITGLIKRLGMVSKDERRDEQNRLQAQIYAKSAGQQEMAKLRKQGIISAELHNSLAAVYEHDIRETRQQLETHLSDYPELEMEMIMQARTDALRSERVAIVDAARRGLISSEIQMELLAQIDSRAEALNIVKATHGMGEADR